MFVNVVFEEKDIDLGIEKWDFDIIDVPEFISTDMENIQQKFFDWLYDESSDHDYRKCIDGIEGYVYGTEEFIEWLNTYLYDKTNEKAKIVSQYLTEMNNNYPSIFF